MRGNGVFRETKTTMKHKCSKDNVLLTPTTTLADDILFAAGDQFASYLILRFHRSVGYNHIW